MRRLPVVLVALAALALVACHGPSHEKPPALVGGRPVRTGPDPVEVEYSDLHLPGDAAYRHYDRYLAGEREADYLLVRRGLHDYEPNVHVTEQIPPEQVIFAGGRGKPSQVYARTSHPSGTHLDFPVHGRVVSVDPDGWTVLLSLSRGQPVQPGDHVTLMRNGWFVGYAKLIEMSDGGTVALLLDSPGRAQPNPGDSVSYFTPQ